LAKGAHVRYAGPSRVATSNGSPTVSASVVALAMATASSCPDAGTRTRVSAEHVWPELRWQAEMEVGMAREKSASPKMIPADFPHSSR
jgi:hypothetical protein